MNNTFNLSDKQNLTVIKKQSLVGHRPLLSPKFNAFKKEEIEQSISDRFEKTVRIYPDRIAVKCKNHTLTYDALNRLANRVAYAILDQQGNVEEPVAFLLEHGAMQTVSMLGILKSGNIYVPIDPSFPKTMIIQILKDCQTRLIITNHKNSPLLEDSLGNEIRQINIDELDNPYSIENPGLSISPDAIANLYYTSGSTGRPKGVMQNHRNVLHFVMLPTNTWPIYDSDRILHLVPSGFSAAPMTTFGALLNGATLLPYDLKLDGLSHLQNWIIKEQVTIYFSVPSIFRHFVSTLTNAEEFSHLRLIVLGGETLYKKDVALYKNNFKPECFLRNIIASTEMLYIRSYEMNMESEITDNIVPVGYPVEDKEVLIFDDDGNKLGFDEVGEIVVKSRYLSPGYWKRPDLTHDVFLDDPGEEGKRLYFTGDMGLMRSDGCLMHLGRKDSMVKIRGQRVEISAVEKALYGLDMVKETAVVAQEGSQGNKYLAAYIVLDKMPKPTAFTLRQYLKKTLPDFMIPSFFIFLKTLPLTPSGKVNRLALPKISRNRSEIDTAYVAPRDELENQIVEICEKIFDISPIGIRDNFYDMGIDSILYFRMFVEIEKNLGKKLALDTFFQTPTIEHMADVLRLKDRYPSKTSSATHIINRFVPFSSAIKPDLSTGWLKTKVSRFIKYLILTVTGAMIPYEVGARFLSWFCDQRRVKKIFFQGKITLLKQFLSLINGPEDRNTTIRHNLTCNFIRKWRLAALSHLPPVEFDRWVRVKGILNFHQSYQKGRGLILANSHFVVAFCAQLLLNRMGFNDLLTLGGRPQMMRLLRLGQWDQIALDEKQSQHLFFGPMSLYKAKPVLERGGIVVMAPDGDYGSSGISVPFHSRMRFFRSGFAELALTSKADVIPVFVSLEINGKIKVEFSPPINIEAPEISHKERVDMLIRKYAALLEKRWAQEPQNIVWHHIDNFLTLPNLTPEGKQPQD